MLSLKHGGEHMIVWGGFSAGKVGNLHRKKGVLKKAGTLFYITMPHPVDDA